MKEENIEPVDLPEHRGGRRRSRWSSRPPCPCGPASTWATTARCGSSGSRPAVREEQVDEQLEELRHRYALLEPVERPVQMGDLVRAEVQISVDGRQVFRERGRRVAPAPGRGHPLAGLRGGAAGQREGRCGGSSAWTCPSDYPQRSLAGKTCLCSVLVKEVKEERLPELTDAFARGGGRGLPQPGCPARAAGRGPARGGGAGGRRHAIGRRWWTPWWPAATLEFPPQLVEREDRPPAAGSGQRQRRRGCGGATCATVRKSEEELRQELRWEAARAGAAIAGAEQGGGGGGHHASARRTSTPRSSGWRRRRGRGRTEVRRIFASSGAARPWSVRSSPARRWTDWWPSHRERKCPRPAGEGGIEQGVNLWTSRA